MVGERDYAGVSFWLEDTGEPLVPRPSLEGEVEADVAVLGAGYTGLWSAYYLLRSDPSLRVVILEAEVAGFGASGRNGGWCSPNISVGPAELVRRFGRRAARETLLAARGAVDEVGRVAEEEGIDARFRKGGVVRVARGRHELPAVRAAWGALSALGLADGCRVLGVEELVRRVRVERAEGAFFDPQGAVVHPGRLVRGLARAVERRGAVIFERSPVVDFVDGPGPVLRTAKGEVRAGAVVLAGEAYLSRIRRLHRMILPIYSLIVLTEPLPEESWAEIGWEDHECLASFKLSVDYLSRTPDGRILFGGRGAPYRFGSRIRDGYDRHGPTHAMLRESLLDWFPQLAGVRFTHAWGGPLGMLRDWMPAVSFDPASGVAIACGYVGQGVAASNLAGRIVADLILGRDSSLVRLPLVGRRVRKWEPEPLRWLGARYVQRALERLDERGRRTGRPPTGRSLAERLSRH
ncbi:NAD(P)/FAD-dependent oxidoreductase [Rubrobacter naiadicus]|uniref:NAD(P)/FAD-dependent oxidoreductase n=1 Tax=Rubrobacter naiadicus TaxID=1392641 RepID=UPI002362D1E6|nr:FAD-binding oxidoreductase [Rubrobacter naiadicus]